MPCKPGMVGCRRGCLHKRMVMDYRVARHSEEMAREAETLGYETEEKSYRDQHGNLITFKEWLIGLRQEDPES